MTRRVGSPQVGIAVGDELEVGAKCDALAWGQVGPDPLFEVVADEVLLLDAVEGRSDLLGGYPGQFHLLGHALGERGGAGCTHASLLESVVEWCWSGEVRSRVRGLELGEGVECGQDARDGGHLDAVAVHAGED